MSGCECGNNCGPCEECGFPSCECVCPRVNPDDFDEEEELDDRKV